MVQSMLNRFLAFLHSKSKRFFYDIYNNVYLISGLSVIISEPMRVAYKVLFSLWHQIHFQI
jgi:hypothetical protein